MNGFLGVEVASKPLAEVFCRAGGARFVQGLFFSEPMRSDDSSSLFHISCRWQLTMVDGGRSPVARAFGRGSASRPHGSTQRFGISSIDGHRRHRPKPAGRRARIDPRSLEGSANEPSQRHPRGGHLPGGHPVRHRRAVRPALPAAARAVIEATDPTPAGADLPGSGKSSPWFSTRTAGPRRRCATVERRWQDELDDPRRSPCGATWRSGWTGVADRLRARSRSSRRSWADATRTSSRSSSTRYGAESSASKPRRLTKAGQRASWSGGGPSSGSRRRPIRGDRSRPRRYRRRSTTCLPMPASAPLRQPEQGTVLFGRRTS